jgi:predicted nuclease of predicted toxin-antitoxin system
MNFKLDENLPLEVAAAFRDAGHEIDTVQSEGLTGASNPEIPRRIRIE